MSLREIVRNAVLTIDSGDVGEAKVQAEIVRKALKDRGLDKGCHVGASPSFLMEDEHTIEWYAGQLLDIVDREAWFAMNSFINCLDKFCPEK